MSRLPWLVLVVAGCPDAQDGAAHDACNALLTCASVVNPFLVRDFDAAYGSEGVCWETAEDTDVCAKACEDGLVGLWIEYDHAETCDPSDFVEPGSLTVSQFFDEQAHRYCDAIVECNPDSAGCNGYYNYGNPDNCVDYDPLAADVCLDTPYTCSDQYYYSYPVAPAVCADVCG